MSGLARPVRILERLALPAPFGIVFWDFATGARVGDGLEVTLTQVSRPALTTTLIANRAGVWIAPKLPGRADWELAATADWSTLARTYRIAVADRFGRFLPLTIEAELPARGLYQWPHWSGLPGAPLAPLIEGRSPPELDPARIPLFSAPERKVAGPLAELRCELVDVATGAPAPWALVTASCDDERHVSVTRGIGLADKEGRATLFFPYPRGPRRQLPISPPAITDFRWDIDIAAYYVPPSGPAPDAPDLAAIMAQLAHPCRLIGSLSSPPHPLGAQSLSFGRPLVLRTDNPPEGPSSSLFLDRGP
ncbi:MAG TPA: hypothetical protein VGW40_09025 [Allosphingosinicella sp.]|nr:hypothetical protein [Allosphingosinicella sp.]